MIVRITRAKVGHRKAPIRDPVAPATGWFSSSELAYRSACLTLRKRYMSAVAVARISGFLTLSRPSSLEHGAPDSAGALG
jgi:hypothetical protein